MNESPCDFVVTKGYRMFAEFCDACRRYRYVGVCYGSAGVGKTQSARHYTCWEVMRTFSRRKFEEARIDTPPPVELANCRSVLYTPGVVNTPRRVESELGVLCDRLNYTVEDVLDEEYRRSRQVGERRRPPDDYTELVIVDEADRLGMASLEQLRDLYDREGFALVLIGMPGLEKKLARYAQLYSRVGFVHHYKSLSAEEMQFILRARWKQWGLSLSSDDFTDAEAVAAIARITSGNFRLLQRLLAQIERVMEVNRLGTITKDVVETARESLVIGPSG